MRDCISDVLDGVGGVSRVDVQQLVRQKLLHRVQREAGHRPRHNLRPDHVEERRQEQGRIELIQGPVDGG